MPKQQFQFPAGWRFAILILALVVLVRLPSIQQPLDNDSGAIAYHARLINQGEPLYGTHHPAHHLPGSYYTYAFIFRILGDNPASLKIALIFVVWLTAWLLFLLGRQLAGEKAGFLAAAFFALIGSMTNLLGDSAEIELFANLPLTLGIWLAARLIQKRSQPAVYILAGMVGALAFLYKVNYLASLAALGVAILLEAVLEKKNTGWITFIWRSLALLCGVGIVLGPVVGYFISLGYWERFLLVFQMGVNYVGMNQAQPVSFFILIPILIILQANAALFVISMVGAIRIIKQTPQVLRSDRSQGLVHILVVTWLVVSIFEVGSSRMPFPHYGLLLIPPLSLVTALEIIAIYKQIPKSSFRLACLPALMVAMIIANTLFTSRNYLGGYFQYITGQKTCTEFVRQDTGLGDQKNEAILTANYLASHTFPTETIFLWSDQAQIYYHANRRASTDIIWPQYIAALGSPERVFVSRPRYIVIGPVFLKNYQTPPDWLVQELASHYSYETTIGPNSLYRRKTP